MGRELYLGQWEEIAEKHADELKGHRVEVRVVDLQPTESQTTEERMAAFNRSMEEIERLTKGKGYIRKHLTSEDFYGEDAK